MKKIVILILLCLGSVTLNAQIPYFGSTVGKEKIFGYTSVKFRPNQNAFETYTTLQFGVTDWFSVGTDVYANKQNVDHGLYTRVGYKWSQWLSAGTQITYQSNMVSNYDFSNINAGFFLNGDILSNGYLFWSSNTWLTFNSDGNHSYKQWWYLGGNIGLNWNNSIVPMLGVIHSWKFDEPLDIAMGAYYVYKKYSFYIWGNDFSSNHPRITLAIDFTF